MLFSLEIILIWVFWWHERLVACGLASPEAYADMLSIVRILKVIGLGGTDNLPTGQNSFKGLQNGVVQGVAQHSTTCTTPWQSSIKEFRNADQ